MTVSLLDQMPRLSAYDPGAIGEGGVDPMGSGAVADRIANWLVPGLRARMSQPRFATLSAVGAVACQCLRDLSTDDGKTTADLAFEWLVVESLVRSKAGGRREGLPGNLKASRAHATNQRLSRRTYLNGPRVFGFTGVYRPFSRDAGLLASDDLPGPNAPNLLKAWELDHGLPGYIDGIAGTVGGNLRKQVEDTCRRSLEKGECTAPVSGSLMIRLADCLAPREARAEERKSLRRLVAEGGHEIRDELAARVIEDPPPSDISQHALATRLLAGSGQLTRRALQAAIDYETATTAIDNAFRRFLAHTLGQHGAVIDRAESLRTPELASLAPRIGDLARRAIDSVAALGDVGLTNDAVVVLQDFARRFTSSQFFEALLERHEQVQAARNKLSWLDRIGDEWTVRTPYRNQDGDLDDGSWTHPMRVVTLAQFLRETA